VKKFKIFLCILALSFPIKAMASFYDLPLVGIDGEPMDTASFKGKVILVAVTATECGNSHQFGSLQKLWDTYRDKGFIVLGMPTNDFGLEPRSGTEIKEYCSITYNAEFPMTSLSHVQGKDMHPFYKQVQSDLGKEALPAWNFVKYLVDREGKIIKFFPTQVQPLTEQVKGEIEKALSR